MPKQYVGVDVSKYKFDACIKNNQNEFLMKPKTFAQNLAGFKRFIHDIENTRENENADVIIGMESTARYHLNLMGYLLENGYDVREFNPIEVYGIRKTKIRRTKTDPIDAGMVASALILDSMENTKRYIKDQDYIRMREIGLLHHRLSDKIGKLKVEMREALTVLCPGYDSIFTDILGKSSKEILRKTVKQTKLFEISKDEIEAILRQNYQDEKKIRENTEKVKEAFDNTTVPEIYKESLVVQVRFILDQHDLMKKQIKMLDARISRSLRDISPMSLSIPGVGHLTCAVVLGNIGSINRFKDPKALTAYAGLDPRIIQSGKSINRTGRISKTGNKYMRRYLLNAAYAGCKSNPVIRKKYRDLRARGKPHLVALTACARKLLMIMYSVEKNQKEFYIPPYISED
jgi:transposase